MGSALNRYVNFVIAKNICHNALNKIMFFCGIISNTTGIELRNIDILNGVQLIHNYFANYFFYANITPDDIHGCRILEVGPGDNFGVALSFIAAGAKQVVCLDKYEQPRSQNNESLIYKALAQSLSGDALRRFNEAIIFLPDQGYQLNPERIRYVTGTGIENADTVLEPGFDYIVSTGVLQYIAQLDKTFRVMDHLLVPGGTMVHCVDLSDPGVSFSQYGHHPLTFLTIPEPIYRLMTSASPKASRYRASYYIRQLEGLGHRVTLYANNLVGIASLPEALPYDSDNFPAVSKRLVDAIRPRLAKSFRQCPDKELMISGIFFASRKPAAAPTRA